MKKKIIITILGLLILMVTHISINIFVFDRGIKGVLLTPLWSVLYSGYMFLMVKRYIGLL
jgi:hypothetical protein